PRFTRSREPTGYRDSAAGSLSAPSRRRGGVVRRDTRRVLMRYGRARHDHPLRGRPADRPRFPDVGSRSVIAAFWPLASSQKWIDLSEYFEVVFHGGAPLAVDVAGSVAPRADVGWRRRS